ncbi:WYL domain-containing protein [Myxococcota bacterium]|jgi:proteasome accessory factor C|nr:WYL domain-containing protein [Myxococcota bacterium]
MDASQASFIQIQLLTLHLRQAGGPMTVRELARRARMSEDQVRRMLEDLALVRGDPSVYEYVEILLDGDMVELGPNTQDVELGALVLSPGEFLALVHAVREAEQAGLGITMKACMPLLRRLAGSVRPREDLPVEFHLDALADEWIAVRDVAIPGRHVLELDYWTASRDRVSRRREVVPLRLRNDGGSWYLEAWCFARQENRTFRLDRVIGMRDTGRVHADPIPERVAAPRGGKRVARVRIDPEVAPWALERIPGAHSLPDGSVEAVIPFSSEVLFASWILSLSGHARVLDPPGLRRQIRQRLRKAFLRDGSPI